MNHVSRIAHSDVGAFIGSAPVPGDAPLLGGGVVGISNNSEKIQAAVRFIKWVKQTEIANRETKRLDGTGIDTKKVELIIGLSIKKALQGILNIEQTIEYCQYPTGEFFLSKTFDSNACILV